MARRRATEAQRVRVRMYRQGLGDCFLLSFFTGDTAVHVLIDCGVLKGTEQPEEQMTRVAQDIHDTTNGHLHLLIATHEHWDHVSGFLQAKPVFDNVSVGEVWLAWTENPLDELANELRKRREKAKTTIATAVRHLEGSGVSALEQTAKRLDALLGFDGGLGVAAHLTTAGALDWVKGRASPEPRYLNPGELTELPGVSGVRVYVLGPPHDRAQIRRSDPSKAHSQVYELAGDLSADLGFMAAAEALERAAEAEEQPFDASFRVQKDEAEEVPFFAQRYAEPGSEWRQIENDWLGVAGRLALQLDGDTNNTSLVLAFELRDGSVLLFPGDAQVGNWESWESLEWRVPEGDGSRVVKSRDLLERTVLYKVGHHGSHNATLREQGLELMTSGELTALIPVNRAMAKKKGWAMPFPSLYRRLGERTRGRILDVDLGAATERLPDLTEDEWARFDARTDVQPLWVDYTLEF